MGAGNFFHRLRVATAIAVVTYVVRIVGSCLVDVHIATVCTRSTGVGAVLIFMRTGSALYGFYIAAVLVMNVSAYTIVLF